MSSHKETIKFGKTELYVIHIRDKSIFSQYVKESEYPADLWSSNFDYLWAVSNPREDLVLWRVVGGMLAIFKWHKKRHITPAFLPLGKGDPDTLAETTKSCLAFCRKWNGSDSKTYIRAVNDRQLAYLQRASLYDKYFKHQAIKGVDRHVSIPQLVTLKGMPYANVRNCINRIKRNFPDTVIRRAVAADIPALLELKQRWNMTSGRKYGKIWDDEAYRRLVKHHQELGHLILVAEYKGSIIGMSSGEVLPHGQAWGFEAKKLSTYYGLSELMMVEIAKEIHQLHPQAELLNLGVDLGAKDGLRAYKDKFHPVLNAERFRLYLK